MEKKITISDNLYNKILNDKEDFGYIGSNNDFYCDIILNTYDYDNPYKQMEKIINLLSGRTKECSNNEIIETIKELKDEYQYKDWMTQIAISIIKLSERSYPLIGDRKEIFIRETEKTNGNLEKILNEFAASSASEIYKNILLKYISYPAYIREQIIHQKNYKELNECIKKKIKCKIVTVKGNTFIVEPYKMLPGKDEGHNYLTCYSTSDSGKYNRSIQSYKLSTIANVYKIFEPCTLSEDELSLISTRLNNNGPAYISSELIDYEIEFDHHAQSLFNSIEKDRPKRIAIKPGKIEYYNDKPQQYLIYTLRCTEFQILNYLKQFSYHVKILNNDSLKKKLMEYYEKAYKQFN